MKLITNAQQRYHYSIVLLKQLVKTDFKLRYQGSALGYLWSLLRPLLIFVIMYLVFVKFLRVGNDIEHYPTYLLLGIVLWNFFTEITTGSIGSVVGKGDLIRKINFPKYVIVLAGSVSALINLALNAVVILLFMFLNHISLHAGMLWTIPLVFLLYVFALGLAFFLSALFVRFRDVAYIWDVLMQGAFYATPIFYTLTMVPPKAREILMLNPVAQIMQEIRFHLITPQTITLGKVFPSMPYIYLLPVGIIVAVSAVSALYFRKRSKHFAEEV
jgi:ABC-2 type transport system permease protein